MHMLGAMYGLTDRITLMTMIPYIEKDMTAIRYRGPVGTTVLGRSSRQSRGLGDMTIGAVFRLLHQGRSGLTASVGLSLPTGSITKTGPMLTPAGLRPTGRLAYPMQLGSGTYDVKPALNWQTGTGLVRWGVQARGMIRTGTNDQGYSLGDEASANVWASYRAAPWISLSGRIEARTVGRIDGCDPMITGPAPGADPRNIGGEFVTLFAGVDLTPGRGVFRGQKLGFELGLPIHQGLNGPMLKPDRTVSVAWRRMF